MNSKVVAGRILSYLGDRLQDESSPLYNSIELSDKQLLALFSLFHTIASPAFQVLYISDLAMRWKVTNRTIQNWLHDRVIPAGRLTDGDTRMHWLSTEIDAIEEDLVRLGYVRKEKLGKHDKQIVMRLQDFM